VIVRCTLCGQTFTSGAGLSSHTRSKHPRHKGANRRAIDKLLESTVREVDPATEQAARSIADALDLDPTNAQMWRTYREVITGLVEEDSAGDEIEAEIEAIRGTAKVGHLKAV
jgi:hypothetical protein